MASNKHKVSIKDVAKHAGVGLGTVSRAINNSGSISPQTKKKVMQSIKELGYTPNRLAQSMRSRKYKNVVFFVDLSNITFSRIANGIYSQLENQGIMLSLCNIGKRNVLEKIESFMNGRQFDGIIVAPPSENDEALNQYLQSLDIPIVTLEINIPGIAVGVTIDYYTSVKKATTYLLSLGHRHTALLCGSTNIRSNRQIIEAFQDAFSEKHLELHEDMIFQKDAYFRAEAQPMLDILHKIRSGKITAVICMHTQLLHSLLYMMKDNRLTYPDDLSLIALEDYELTQLLNPSLTVIRRSLFDIGIKISQVLINYINNPETYGELPPYRIPTQFITRDSCKPVEDFTS